MPHATPLIVLEWRHFPFCLGIINTMQLFWYAPNLLDRHKRSSKCEIVKRRLALVYLSDISVIRNVRSGVFVNKNGLDIKRIGKLWEIQCLDQSLIIHGDFHLRLIWRACLLGWYLTSALERFRRIWIFSIGYQWWTCFMNVNVRNSKIVRIPTFPQFAHLFLLWVTRKISSGCKWSLQSSLHLGIHFKQQRTSAAVTKTITTTTA